MNSLVIDTSTSHLVIGILKNNELIKYYNELIEKEMSTTIFPIMEAFFKDSKMVASEIDTIFVVNGPGSFTGIRVGLTIAKVYAWTKKIRIIPISSLQMLASTPFTTDYIVPLIDARRGYVFAGIYDNELNTITDDTHILLITFLEQLDKSKSYTFISYDIFDQINVEKPNIDIIAIVNKNDKKQGINPHILNPNYLKMTEAEEKLMSSND